MIFLLFTSLPHLNSRFCCPGRHLRTFFTNFKLTLLNWDFLKHIEAVILRPRVYIADLFWNMVDILSIKHCCGLKIAGLTYLWLKSVGEATLVRLCHNWNIYVNRANFTVFYFRLLLQSWNHWEKVSGIRSLFHLQVYDGLWWDGKPINVLTAWLFL